MSIMSADTQRLYRLRFNERDRQAKAAVWKVLVESFFQRWVSTEDTVLDLGCGYCEFLNYLRCARRIGVDLNPDSPEFLDDGIEFHFGSIADLEFLPTESVDVVFTSNVLEHLADKREVEAALSEARRVLRPGGHLIAMGPNLRFLPGEYWDFWDHLVPITDRSLSEVLQEQGFAIADCIAKFLPYTTRSGLPKATLFVHMYLRVPFVWRILGGQFLIRARKA